MHCSYPSLRFEVPCPLTLPKELKRLCLLCSREVRRVHFKDRTRQVQGLWTNSTCDLSISPEGAGNSGHCDGMGEIPRETLESGHV